MQYCHVPETRESVFLAWTRKVKEGGAEQALLQLVKSRRKKARALGFKNYLEWEASSWAVNDADGAGRVLAEMQKTGAGFLGKTVERMERLQMENMKNSRHRKKYFRIHM